MGIVSYAQNLEDVMLWRVFGGIPKGFYVDIGAQESIRDSVSFAFYKHGWNGIDVEPVAEYAERLRQDRPRNIVIEAVVTDNIEELKEIYCIPDTGLSTLDPQIAREHQAKGFEVVVRSVKTLTLDDVFSLHEGEIHWAKIDVEGHERQVIKSWSSAQRPWILVVEAVAPLSRSGTELEWEDLVFAKGYKRVWFDGLNIFYLHEDHLDKIDLFAAPPNVFDEFQLSGEASSTFHRFPLRQGDSASTVLEMRLDEARAHTALLQVEFQRRLDELEADRARILAEHSARFEEIAKSALAREAAFAVELSEVHARLATAQLEARRDRRALEAKLLRERDKRYRLELALQCSQGALKAAEQDLLVTQLRVAELQKSILWKLGDVLGRKLKAPRL